MVNSLSGFLNFYSYFKLFLWQDYIEITVISMTIYFILLWLKKDKHKNLVNAFLIYCIVTFISYFTFLPTLTYIFFTLCPVVLLLFIIFHQDNLQKNFVTLKKIQKPIMPANWIEELIKCCLLALNKNKEIICIIERTDQLDSLLRTPFKCYAELNKSVFEILIDKQNLSDNNLIWINQEGKIIAINAIFKFNLDDHLISDEAKKIFQWKQNGILITSKTDAIIFKIIPFSRTFDIIINGKIAQFINSEQFYKILKSNLQNIDSNLNNFKPVLKELKNTEKQIEC